MRKGIFVLAFVLFAAAEGFSQNKYQSAFGVRISSGYTDLIAASYKTFLGESPSAIELNLGFRPDYGYTGVFNLSLSASYQYHFEIQQVDGLQWFVGGGLTGYRSFSGHTDYEGFGLGIFPTGGIDYKFSAIPLNVSADLRPTIRISAPRYYDYGNFYVGNFGVSARYTLR
ncbi:MAG: hypothetical protein Q8939_05595 [Bacteroidota bacterium]|nr:hypothetical protein [Bacteroidota bacterium]MDP4212933.1 hypothetical protein [Bacteroidota bacterium]